MGRSNKPEPHTHVHTPPLPTNVPVSQVPVAQPGPISQAQPSTPDLSITREQIIRLLEERGVATYIIDRGLIRFGKFAIALLAAFALIGVFLFGVDIKKAAEEAKKANDDAKQTQLQLKTTMLELNEAKAKLIGTKSDLEQSKAEFAIFVAKSRDELQQAIDEASASRARTYGIEQSALSIQIRLNQLEHSIPNLKGVASVAAAAIKSTSSGGLPLATSATPIHVGLVSDVKELSMNDLQRVAAVLQKQIDKDAGPVWSIRATITAYKSLDKVPIDSWPVIIKSDIGIPGSEGYHSDSNGKPFALVKYVPKFDWTFTASRELLDMLVDPYGNRLQAGPSIDPNDRGKAVSYLVEICSPVGGLEQAYQIDGVSLSDFVTPAFFGGAKKEGVKYSFGGSVVGPLKINKQGYISWRDERQKWYQLTWFGSEKPEIRELGALNK